MQYSQEHLKTMVYAKFGGQTECIMGNWKIENGKFPAVGSLELSIRGGDEKRGQMARPLVNNATFSLITQSNSAILNILMCNFLFQLMSSFVIALGF